jgi:hypothetical protein
MTLTMTGLTGMSQAQLDELFRNSPAGTIPDGDADGRVFLAPGTRLEGIAAAVVRLLFWQGKIVDADKAELVNKVTPFGIGAIKAAIYRAPSWLDGREAIILDYSKKSLVARRIRDEIREIAPGLYLGLVFWGRRRLPGFALRFRDSASINPG